MSPHLTGSPGNWGRDRRQTTRGITERKSKAPSPREADRLPRAKGVALEGLIWEVRWPGPCRTGSGGPWGAGGEITEKPGGLPGTRSGSTRSGMLQ